MSKSLSLIYSTFGSEGEARHVARTLLEERLIACANHFAPISSQYEYKGILHDEQEYPVLLKTATKLVKSASERLLALHSFETSAILHWTVGTASPDYENWVFDQIKTTSR